MTDNFTPKHTGSMFKAQMIIAYIENRKDQTRRIKGLQAVNENPDEWQTIFIPQKQGVRFVSFENKSSKQVIHLNMPYGGFGDTLYFKETWKMFEVEETGRDYLHYRADDAKVDQTWWTEHDWTRPDPVWFKKDVFNKWQPSIFMPKLCSRFRNVPILSVRVERLLDISESDAKNEGTLCQPPKGFIHSASYRQAYFELWDSINQKTLPASTNPWVWVYKFQKKDKT